MAGKVYHNFKNGDEVILITRYYGLLHRIQRCLVNKALKTKVYLETQRVNSDGGEVVFSTSIERDEIPERVIPYSDGKWEELVAEIQTVTATREAYKLSITISAQLKKSLGDAWTSPTLRSLAVLEEINPQLKSIANKVGMDCLK